MAAAHDPRMSHTLARTTYSLKLPTLSPRNTPRSGRRPRTPKNLVAAGIAPAPGKEAEILDFTAWVPSAEVADLRWSNTHERRWRQRQADEREQARLGRIKARHAIGSEMKAKKVEAKQQMEEAGKQTRVEVAKSLRFKRRLEEEAAMERQDQLDWRKAQVQEQKDLEAGYRERAKREQEEQDAALKEEMARADDIVQQSQQRQLVRDGKSLVQLQHESDREQVEEVQKKLEADRRAKAQDKWEAEEEAALKHEEALERVDVSRELREYKKKQMEEAIEEQRAETQRVSEVKQHGEDEVAAKEADAREWRKQVLLGLQPAPPSKPTTRPKSGELRKRFLTMNRSERRLVGTGKSPRATARFASEDRKKERVQRAKDAIQQGKAKLQQKQQDYEAAVQAAHRELGVEVKGEWTKLEQKREAAEARGRDLQKERSAHRQAEEQHERARVRKMSALQAAAKRSATEQLADFTKKTLDAAEEKEAMAARMEEALRKDREAEARERRRKMEETEAHIAVLQEEKRRASDEAYRMWQVEQKAEAEKAKQQQVAVRSHSPPPPRRVVLWCWWS